MYIYKGSNERDLCQSVEDLHKHRHEQNSLQLTPNAKAAKAKIKIKGDCTKLKKKTFAQEIKSATSIAKKKKIKKIKK